MIYPPKECRLAYGAHQALFRLGFDLNNVFTYFAPENELYGEKLKNQIIVELREGKRNFVMTVCSSLISAKEYAEQMTELCEAKQRDDIPIDVLDQMLFEYLATVNEIELIVALKRKGFIIKEPRDIRAERN